MANEIRLFSFKGTMIQSYFVYPFGGLFAVAGCYTTIAGFRLCREARITWTWPSTQGSVKHSRVIRIPTATSNRSGFQPEITYQYFAEGRNHIGKRIKIIDIASTQRYARRIVAGYPVGKQVKVYYNPEAPQKSVLQRGNDGNTMGIPAIGIFFFLIGLEIYLGNYFF